MAYTDFTPEFRVQEAQDAMSFRIWDESVWNGESDNTTEADVYLSYYDSDGNLIEYDVYPLIVGANKDKFNEYLDQDGHIIELTDLAIGGIDQADDERFADGYFIVKIVYNDGSYSVGSEPYYENHQAFLAKARCKARKLPINLLSWPLTDAMRIKNFNIYEQRMYLEAAEDSVDLGKRTEFNNFMSVINEIFDYYSIDECF